MKAIQVMFDERLLDRLDATAEVKKDGRSAVLRRAVEDYLRRRRQWVIAEGYRKAYGDTSYEKDTTAGIGGEFPGWEDEGVWPAE